jgi:hypothetical protein
MAEPYPDGDWGEFGPNQAIECDRIREAKLNGIWRGTTGRTTPRPANNCFSGHSPQRGNVKNIDQGN